MYMELLQAWGNNGVLIHTIWLSPRQYFLEEGTTDSGLVPGKFYIGANVETLWFSHSNGYFKPTFSY
jgi:hypothetical protein